MGERLRDVLAAHREDGSYPDTCVCEVEVPDDIEGHWSAHLEAVVLAWLDDLLGGDEAREVVGCAIAAPQLPSQHAMRYATAALAAVRALVTETGNEGDE